ncbi:unnamed protein product [Caretta caretta]
MSRCYKSPAPIPFTRAHETHPTFCFKALSSPPLSSRSVCKDEGYQKFLTLAVISKSEVDAFTQQPLNTMSEGDAISLSNASLQLTHRDSLNVESSSTASEISQTATEQHVDCAENLKDISPVSLDENIEYIRALMKSNRLMKENIKSNLSHCCNKEESVGGSLLSESDMKSMHSDLIQKNLHSEEDHFSSPYVQRASQLLSKIRSLLSLTEGLLTCQDMDSTIEYSKKSEIITELGEKMKNVTLKKKTLEKEVTSYEEIIECADQRLEIASSQIS